jgi:hypothetical protein
MWTSRWVMNVQSMCTLIWTFITLPLLHIHQKKKIAAQIASVNRSCFQGCWWPDFDSCNMQLLSSSPQPHVRKLFPITENVGLREIQPPGKYEENFDVSSKGPAFVGKLVVFDVNRRRSSPCIFQVVARHPSQAFLLLNTAGYLINEILLL